MSTLEIKDLYASVETKEGRKQILRGVNLTVNSGETHAIMGPNGSGKSTLMNILGCLDTQSSGVCRIGGVDIRKMKRESLRRQIGLVLQEPFLFSQTIRENISATKPQATEEELRRAAAIACVDEAITEFPDGYETVVGERGVTLSGGQKQRVAIARAVLLKPGIILADEPTASLDEANAGQVTLLLSGYARTLGSTLLIVSHDDAVLANMDRVLDLNRGIIREAA